MSWKPVGTASFDEETERLKIEFKDKRTLEEMFQEALTYECPENNKPNLKEE